MTLNGNTPDLLEALKAIHSIAVDARKKFQDKEVVNGRTALLKVERLAGDALHRQKERV